MRLGIDFDNTIVCYDDLFHRVALEGGWIPKDLPANKSDVRNHLRNIGREDIWTGMQGTVYGPRLREAAPFPGVREFFIACRRAGVPVVIISHKTKTPFAGPPHDLHQAAIDWLEAQRFFDHQHIGLDLSNVFLELTKESKLHRIHAAGCTHFIDDLPEFLSESAFPTSTTRILFDPNHLYGDRFPFEKLHDWKHAAGLLGIQESPAAAVVADPQSLDAIVASLLRLPSPPTLLPLPGGANNRVFRVETPDVGYVLKQYFQNPADPRDRFGAESGFYSWIARLGLPQPPQAVAWDPVRRIAILESVPGRKLPPGEITAHHIAQAAQFILALNPKSAHTDAALLPLASEACFTVAEHVARIDHRVARLVGFKPDSDIDQRAAEFIRNDLSPAWERLRNTLTHSHPTESDRPLPPESRCLSPSDFGFHNALVTDEGTVRFLDFEYAGWDDPAKLICDFYCQPQIPVGAEFASAFAARLDEGLGWDGALLRRARSLLPAYRIKWCCILLNEFLRSDLARRHFAAHSPETSATDRKSTQLEKARAMLLPSNPA